MLIGSVDNTISHQNPYAHQVEGQQNQPVNADKTDGASKAEPSKALSELSDEYIPSGDNSESPGIYRLEKDETGKQKIVFDRPASAEKTGEQPEVSAEPNADNENSKSVYGSKGNDGKEETSCTVNTDKVDREIKQLKEEKKQIKQEIKSNQNNEDKRRELEKQLSQVESELSAKDNDAYRKQNATYTYS